MMFVPYLHPECWKGAIFVFHIVGNGILTVQNLRRGCIEKLGVFCSFVAFLILWKLDVYTSMIMINDFNRLTQCPISI